MLYKCVYDRSCGSKLAFICDTQPTRSPTFIPSYQPSSIPTIEPTIPSVSPTDSPTALNYIGVVTSDEQTIETANEYCMANYGTTLASIRSESENNDAQSACQDAYLEGLENSYYGINGPDITKMCLIGKTKYKMVNYETGRVEPGENYGTLNRGKDWISGIDSDYSNWCTVDDAYGCNTDDNSTIVPSELHYSDCLYMVATDIEDGESGGFMAAGSWFQYVCDANRLRLFVCDPPGLHTFAPTKYPPTNYPTNAPFVNIYSNYYVYTIVTHDDSVYFFSNWYNLNQICYDTFGSSLPTISSPQENEQFWSLIDELNSLDADELNIFWTGYNENFTTNLYNLDDTGTSYFVGAKRNGRVSNYTNFEEDAYVDGDDPPFCGYVDARSYVVGDSNQTKWRRRECESSFDATFEGHEFVVICDTPPPTPGPTIIPTYNPTMDTNMPTVNPTTYPTILPTNVPSFEPTETTQAPSFIPTMNPISAVYDAQTIIKDPSDNVQYSSNIYPLSLRNMTFTNFKVPDGSPYCINCVLDWTSIDAFVKVENW